MVLLLDLGNHALKVAVYEDETCQCKFSLYADKLKSEVEYEEALSSYLVYHQIQPKEIEGAILSSVVPSLTKRIQIAVSKVIGKDCLLLDHHLKTSLAIRMDNPGEVGSDLIATAIGALKASKGKGDILIADINSVVSLFLVTQKREYQGGILFPGIRSSLNQMIEESALLSEVELEKPKELLGKNTKEAISIGILKGYSFLIQDYTKALETERKLPLKKYLTGKDAVLLKEELSDSFAYLPNLCFDGLNEIYKRNTLKKERKQNA